MAKVQQDKAASGGNGGGDGDAAAAGEQLVIRAPVHCDGCGRKLRRSLQRLEGVGEVTVDSRADTVVVRGRGAVENAAEVVQVVERKTGEKAVLVSPSPEKLLLPPRSSAPKAQGGETNDTKDIGNELPELDMKMVTVLKINLHCDACSEEIKRRILKITGVEEAMPHLKSSQVAVKGKVEPATLVGFIHKCTGRRAAIIRAEPLDDALLPQPPNPPAAPPSEAESKKDEPPAENPPAKEEEPNEENRGGGEKDNADDDNPKTEKPASDGHGAAEEHGAHATTEAPDRDNDVDAGDGLVLENHTKAAVDRLFAVPTPAGVVTVVAPEMALGSRSYCYPAYPCAQYYYPYQQHLYPPQPYPAASAYSPVAMYGYPASYPPEAFSEENPNACTIV